jgi:hypothetical protein
MRVELPLQDDSMNAHLRERISVMINKVKATKDPLLPQKRYPM